jgi:D-alanine-D-alanine ligase
VAVANADQRHIALHDLERSLANRGPELALFLAYDRPAMADERPALARTFFAQRCVSDIQLNQTIEAFREVDAYVELFEDERSLIAALAEERLQRISRPLKVVYNGIEGGVLPGGFEPGRNALIPAVADAYGLIPANANAYACALGRHKFHYLTLLRALGVPTPSVWNYSLNRGWALNGAPPEGAKVIAKSTYESWSVGVTDASVFVVDESCEERVAQIADELQQPVTVQEFISGREVCVPVLAYPDPVAMPAMEAVLAKAPGDPDAVMTIHDTLGAGGVSHRPFCSSPSLEARLRVSAQSAFDAVQFGSFTRVDFRIDADDRPWVTDLGPSPGIGATSSAFRSLAELGFDHPSFLRLVVAATLRARNII